MKDYTHLYRDELPTEANWSVSWDLFISAYNRNDRVVSSFERANAALKHWLIHPEYNLGDADLPTGHVFRSSSFDESEFILDYIDNMLTERNLKNSRICVDATGFMRPHLLFLIKYLIQSGVDRFDVLYSEPRYYVQREKTQFSDNAVTSVRQIRGFEGVIENDTSRDLLIIGTGYEKELVAEVAEDKDKARKMLLMGLPSLSADMYQQNAWRTQLAADAIGENIGRFFAPANDPFVTATILSEIVEKEERAGGVTNLYLAPLATKAQAIGFALFYCAECAGRNASLLFPFSRNYLPETSRGMSRVWKYQFELPS